MKFVAGAILLCASCAQLSAAIIAVGDEFGNVGVYNTDTATGTPLGTSSVSVGQVIGLAYDASSDQVILLDRNSNHVIGMNATTGTSSLLFNSSGAFQGGAMSGGMLYGIFENNQTIGAYSFPAGVNTINGDGTPGHTHGMGVDSATGQLYLVTSDGSSIWTVNSDGTLGSIVLTALGLGNAEDVDYFGGNFLVATYSNELILVDGITGTPSVFIDSTQIAAMGLAGSITGVAVLAASEVPEPSSLVLFGLGLAGLGVCRRKLSR